MKKRVLAVLAYVIPTFPLGYLWHLTILADHYESLTVFREDIIVPLGIIAMLIQGVIWLLFMSACFLDSPY